MADYGLEVFDGDGNKTLSVGDRVGRLLGEVQVNGDGSQYNAGLSTGTPFYVLVSTKDYASNDGGYNVWFSGDRIRWTVEDGYGSVRIIYGVY